MSQECEDPSSFYKNNCYYSSHNPDHNYSTSTALQNIQTSPCVQISCLRFGATESATEQVQDLGPPLLNGSHFQTLHWRTHSSPDDYKKNKISKTIIPTRCCPSIAFTCPSEHIVRNGICASDPDNPSWSFIVIWDPLNNTKSQNISRPMQLPIPRHDYIRPWLSGFFQRETAPLHVNCWEVSENSIPNRDNSLETARMDIIMLSTDNVGSKSHHGIVIFVTQPILLLNGSN
jgi:hypothetical protein